MKLPAGADVLQKKKSAFIIQSVEHPHIVSDPRLTANRTHPHRFFVYVTAMGARNQNN